MLISLLLVWLGAYPTESVPDPPVLEYCAYIEAIGDGCLCEDTPFSTGTKDWGEKFELHIDSSTHICLDSNPPDIGQNMDAQVGVHNWEHDCGGGMPYSGKSMTDWTCGQSGCLAVTVIPNTNNLLCMKYDCVIPSSLRSDEPSTPSPSRSDGGKEEDPKEL